MGRTILAIYDEMIAEKENFSSLDALVPNLDTAQGMLTQLSTASKVGVWRLQLWIVAFAIFTHEGLQDVFRAEVEQRALDIIPSTPRNLVLVAKEFQNGFSLEFNDTTRKFEYEDSTSADALAAQIVTQASVLDANRVVTYKIAKPDGLGLQALSAPEITSFEAYLDRTKIAGTKTIVISAAADYLKAAYTIQYNPEDLASDGSLIADGTFPIQEAIDAYIEGLPFDTTFRVQDLTDAIQAARGVVNAVADVIEAKGSSITAYTDIQAVSTETYQAVAGYLATTNESGTDASPVIGSIPVLTAAQAPDYNATITYVVGDIIRQAGIVYKNKTAVTVPEAFTIAKWSTISNITFITA